VTSRPAQASIRDRQRRALARASRTDMLTGVLNRRGFEERFDAELARAQRDVADLSLVLVDLDDFKAVNDTQGHPAGDELLRWVSEAIAGELRASDAIGRLGGDEFAVMLAGGGSDPREVLERLLTRLSERTGASAGAASFPADGHERDDLFKRADVALYERKQTRPAPGLPRQRGLSWASSLATTADERMGGAHSHSDAVSDYAAGAARQLGWQEAELGLLRLAAVLHDVGKVDVPMHILRKRGPLDDSEYAEMTKYAAAGAQIAACVDGLETSSRGSATPTNVLTGVATQTSSRVSRSRLPRASFSSPMPTTR
jgi:diguanylate cyclase (GGDEF)-like protein